METVGVQFESNPSEFIAATRQVMESSGQALRQFDLTSTALRRLSVSYLQTSDAAKQSAIVQRMVAIQTANTIAAEGKAAADAQVAANARMAESAKATAATTVGAGESVALTGSRIKDSALTAVFGVAAFGAALKVGFDNAQEVSRAQAILAANIAATGAQGTLTAGVLSGVSEELQKVGLFSQATATSAEAMLAQFSNVASSRALFEGAATAAGNLARQTGTSLPDAATKLGKALQDPLTATRGLRSLNVLLTQDQQAQIKNMIKMGDTASAQNLIMQVATSKSAGQMQAFGGTTAGALAKTKLSLEETATEALNRVAPALKFVGDHASGITHLAVAVGEVWIAFKAYTILNNVMTSIAAWRAKSIAAASETAASAATAAAATEAAWTAAFANGTVSAEAFTAAATAGFATIAASAGAEGAIAGSSFRASMMASLGPVAVLLGIGVAAQPYLAKVGAQGSAGLWDAVKKGGKQGGIDYLNAHPDELPAGSTAAAAATSAATAPVASYIPTHRTDLEGNPTYNRNITPIGVGVPNVGGGGGGGGGSTKPTLTAYEKALAAFKAGEDSLGQTITAAMPSITLTAAQVVNADRATLKQTEAEVKHARTLREAAKTSADKKAATDLLTRAKRQETQATKNLHAAQTEAAAAASKQAADAAAAAITLANARLEAGIDWSSQVSVAQARLQEAKNTLGGDKNGTPHYYSDLAAVNQAMNDLKSALAGNTTATTTNTQAMTGFLVGGEVPSYEAIRGAANAGAYYSGGGSRGASGGSVVIQNLTVSGAVGTPQQVASALAGAIVIEINKAQNRSRMPVLAQP